MVADSEGAVAPGIGVKDFGGGLYAVTQCRVVGGPGVPATWRALLRWVHHSQCAWRRDRHELERIRNPLSPAAEIVLDLCLPVRG
jgi:DNA gyrase inhibitor GyrI